MAQNRFKKSIESATDNTNNNTKDSININRISNSKPDRLSNLINSPPEGLKDTISENLIGIIKEIVRENISENIPEKATDDILKKVLDSERKPKGSNHTFYLSAEVGDALARITKRSKKSKSTLVDEILREVLVNGR